MHCDPGVPPGARSNGKAVADLLYVYAVVPMGTDLATAPAGLDDAPVRRIEEREMAALVSAVRGDVYAAERVEQQTEDVAWVAPRATAHDRVVTWAGDRGPVIPLPMFTLFRGEDRVRAMMRDRERELRETMTRVAQGEEYGLRIFRIEATLLGAVDALSSRLEALARQSREATPGQRYLVERKLEAERRNEMRRIAAGVAHAAFASLTPLALESTREAVPAKGRDGTSDVAILNAYFLIKRGELEPFQRTLTELVREHGDHGFRFDFTGPWPPYHFVRGRDASAPAAP